MSAGHINVFVIGSRMKSVIFLVLLLFFKPFQSNLQNTFLL